jgi:hypothetical protein
MPPSRLRLAGEAAFLVLVALGLWLAQLDPVVIGVALVTALVLANADGDLPFEYDGRVRESFGPILASEREPAAAP